MNPELALMTVLPTVGPTELIILLTIILLLFGAKRIPELARGLGIGVREFKKGTSDEMDKDEVGENRKGETLSGSVVEDNSNKQ
jgi:sec-independent protein translocase protein TatA